MQQKARPIINTDDPMWWDSMYRAKRTPWDIGQPSPPLITYLKSPYAVKPGKIIAVGCGYGHETLPFIQAGFEVTGLDFAPTPIAALHERFEQMGVSGTKGYLLNRDFFNVHEYDGYYDYALDHCFFGAIDPARRRHYVRTMVDLLKPGGKLISLFWIMQNLGGPPFALAKDDIYAVFDKHFTIDIAYTPQDSIKNRTGNELLMVMTKRQ